MKRRFALAWLAFGVAVFAAVAHSEELERQGEVVEVDLEGSLLVIDTKKGDRVEEWLFEVDELTEIRSYSEESSEPVRIKLSDISPGDYVRVRFEVVRGRNVATLISRNHADHA